MKTSSKTMLIAGFASMILILVIIIGFWLNGINRNLEAMHSAVGELLESQEVFTMRDSALRRVITLFRMSGADDPFERDDYYMQSKQLAQDFIIARDKLLNGSFYEWEADSWNRAQPHIRDGYRIQNQIIDLILDEKRDEAAALLRDKGVDTQERVMKELTTLLESQTNAALKTLEETDQRNKFTFIVVAILGAIAICVGVIVSIFILRRAGQVESVLIDQAERIRLLYEISSTSGVSYEDKVTQMLQAGCQLFDVEIGEVCRIVTAKQKAKLISVHAPPGIEISPDAALDINNPFFKQLLESDGMACPDISQINERAYAANYGITGIKTCISVPVYVNETLFGIVNFISRQVREHPFSETDRDLLKLIGNWMSVTYEKQLSNQELARSREIAENANKSKSTFLANMSHEIRTPLTAIIGFSETLLNHQASVSDHDRSVTTIIRAGKHLQHVINDILDLSKIEAGELEVERIPVSPVNLVSEVESIVGARAREKGLVFTVNYAFPLPETINSDPTRIKQILINLCGNAVKFTESGSVTVNVSCNKEQQKLVFAISDTGIGMDNKERKKLFTPFSQADTSTTRKYGGTGLGLCISKQLAEKLGGTLTCLSQKGLGSKFTVVIDNSDPGNVNWIDGVEKSVSRQDETCISTGTNTVPSLSGHILLAEDTPDNQQLISMYVSNTGAKITIVDNGQLAVEHALDGDYDLILMDMQMPVMGGLEATTWLRRTGYEKPVVALTASAMKEDRDKCEAAGVDDYLVKPIDLKRFYNVLMQYLPDAKKPEFTEEGEHSLPAFEEDPVFLELARNYLQNLPNTIKQMQQVVNEGSWNDARIFAHNLKGTGGGFGFPEISKIASKMQSSIINKDYAAVQPLMDEMQELCTRLSAQQTRTHVA